jgi:hypothetical protein
MTGDDPTTAALLTQGADRDQLRAEVERLERALVAALAEVEAVKAERDRLTARGDALFVEGYDQAVREIRDHFAETEDDVSAVAVAEIEATWMRGSAS